MTYIELWRFFKLPIIQAPRRNSNLHKEMWSMARFSRWRRSACFVCAPLDEATRGRLIQVWSAIFGRLTSGEDESGFSKGRALPECLGCPREVYQ
jgi:hypothetical protein